MKTRFLSALTVAAGLLFLSGCGSITHHLPGHGQRELTAPVSLVTAETRLALTTPARLPAPGGFKLILASENPDIVSVRVKDGAMGSARYTLEAHTPGQATLHYVNGFTWRGEVRTEEERQALRTRSLGSFTVTVTPAQGHATPE